ncbi:hypothetical protein [Cellulosimicrobium sp. CUA-896]|uniref:MmyB family transcriptional regulator n=1 Tax=Cellulosimicrobium sp. CUA-896 TaxID=1517881 RepID=UPI0035164835
MRRRAEPVRPDAERPRRRAVDPPARTSAALWASHDVRLHRTGTKEFHHPEVGTLGARLRGARAPRRPAVQLNVYTAAPGSPSDDAMRLLASWAATALAEPAEAGRAEVGVPGGVDRRPARR